MHAVIAQQSAQVTHDQVMLALVGIIGTCVAALVFVIRNSSKLNTIASDASQTNLAVNHKETGELSLYRTVAAISATLGEIDTKVDAVIAKQAEFDRRWGNLPADINDAVSLHDTLTNIEREIAAARADLVDHIAAHAA